MNKTNSKLSTTTPTSKPPPHPSSSPTAQNPSPSPKKQFPSITLSKHLQDYKAYRPIDTKKKYPDIDKNNTFTISPQQKSILMMRNLQMPSIHNANQMSFIDGVSKVQKLQVKVLKELIKGKKEEEWRLYMTKSELVQGKGQECEEIQEFLLRFIHKCLDKTLFNTTTLEQSSHQQSQKQKKATKTSSSFLLQPTPNALTKKPSQPSLRLLKDQLSSMNTKDLSINDPTTITTKTALNFRQHEGKQSALIEKIEARYEEEINRMIFQRSLLEKKLELYQGRIGVLEARLREEGLQVDGRGEEGAEDMQPELGQPFSSSSQTQSHPTTKPPAKRHQTPQQLMLSSIITQNKYKSEAEFKKIQNQTLTKQLTLIKEFSFKLKMDNEHLHQQLQLLQQQCRQCRQYKKYKELWLMQGEEMIGWKAMWKERKEEAHRLGNKIKILKEKNKQLLHSFNFSMVVNPDQEEDKQELDNIIKGFQDWLKVISVPRVNFPIIDPKPLLQEQGLKQQQYMPDPQNTNYKLLKPNFFIFFQAYEKTIMMQKNILNTRPLQPTFYVKIRAILDSMYNHFNSYNSSYKHWTSFPEFVIGFLQKYEINFATMKMQQRKKTMSSEEKLTFLMNLFNKKLSNTWECDLFRSFIMEEYTLDQIYFFLDCRNDLNGGATLMHGLGVMDPVSYVKLGKALATAQRKLFPYENYIIERVKTILKSRKKEKNGQMFIDRHFVLKLLLEVYSLQKSKSERIFQASFKSSKPTRKSPTTVTYSDYFSFMSKNFDFLTTMDICELYRQTYSLSSGKITHKAVHYVCQSRGLFIPLIWSKRLNMNVLEKSLNNDMMLLDLQNSARKMNGHLAEVGVEEVSRLQNDLNYFLRQLDWYRNNRQVFYYKLQQIKIRIIKANCILDWQSSTYTPNQLLSTQQIRQGILQVHSLMHQSDSATRLLSRKREEKEKAMRQLTHNFKVRIQESIREFRRVDDEQLRRLKEQVAMEIRVREKRGEMEGSGEGETGVGGGDSGVGGVGENMKSSNTNSNNKRTSNLDNINELQDDSNTQSPILIGNSFSNVNDLLMDKIYQAKAAKNSKPPIKDNEPQRKESKLKTISEVRETIDK